MLRSYLGHITTSKISFESRDKILLLRSWSVNYDVIAFISKYLNPLNANPTKWSNTVKQFVGKCRRIVSVCLTILWGWCLSG